MKAKTPNSKWWLVAILTPVLCLGLGLLLALGAASRENDWLGLRAIAPLFWGLTGGCFVSCVATAVSAIKKERLWPAALVAGIPSLLFLIYLYSLMQQAKQPDKRNREYKVFAEKRENELRAKIEQWCSEIRANPMLMTSDEFWRSKNDSNGLTQVVVANVLQDKSFEVTPQIKSYVIKNYPGFAAWVFMYGRSSQEELESIVRDEKFPNGVRNSALEWLLRDESFYVSPELKRFVIDHFPSQFSRLHFTKRELEDLAADPTVSEWVRKTAVKWLKEKTYTNQTPDSESSTK